LYNSIHKLFSQNQLTR